MPKSAMDGHPLYQRLKTLLQEAKTLGERKVLAEALFLDCRLEEDEKRRRQIGEIMTEPPKKAKARPR